MFTATENMNRVDSEFIFHIYKILPVILSLLGATLSFLLYSFGSGLLVQLKLSVLGKKIYHFFLGQSVNRHHYFTLFILGHGRCI